MKKIKKEKAIVLLTELIHEIDTLGYKGINSIAFKQFIKLAQSRISGIFGSESTHLKSFNDIYYTPPGITLSGMNAGMYAKTFLKGLDEARALLVALKDE